MQLSTAWSPKQSFVLHASYLMSSDDVKLTLAKSDAVYNLKFKGSPSVTRTLLACPVSKGTTVSGFILTQSQLK